MLYFQSLIVAVPFDRSYNRRFSLESNKQSLSPEGNSFQAKGGDERNSGADVAKSRDGIWRMGNGESENEMGNCFLVLDLLFIKRNTFFINIHVLSQKRTGAKIKGTK